MTRLKRVSALEAKRGSLSPLVRAWLGQSLTPAEQEQAHRESTQPIEPDWDAMSKEARSWLRA